MRRVPAMFLFAGTLWAAPLAAEPCAECPRVQLLKSGSDIRIAAEDDRDLYHDLRHRVRFVSDDGASTWTPWGDTNAYGVAPGATGRVEAETIDLEGNVGRGVIRIATPDEEPGSRGPGTVEEDSSTEAQWEAGSIEFDGSTVASAEEAERQAAEEAANSAAEDWFTEQEWDHSICPVGEEIEVTLTDDDSETACSTAEGRPNSGLLAALIALGALVLGRRTRRL